MLSASPILVWKLVTSLILSATLCQSHAIHSHHHYKAASHHSSIAHVEELNHWLDTMVITSQERILDNISPAGSETGCVVASPSKKDPDYFYYWVRDGALTMDTLAVQYENAEPGSQIEKVLENNLKDYIQFVQKIITVPNLSGHAGEPKYEANATAFEKGWGRPQNDGPPLQALLLMNFYRIHSAKANSDQHLLRSLYQKGGPQDSLIKFHLDHTVKHWKDSCFDLWEEQDGDHFWTKMVQRKALIVGAKFALEMGDEAAADYYTKEIPAIEKAILNHWDHNKNRILENLKHGTQHTFDKKSSGLDVGTVLAALRGSLDDHFFTADDDKVLSTMYQLMKGMKKEYKINHEHSAQLGVAVGRYTEDVYDGNGFSLGNPWYLATNAMSELLFVAGQRWVHSKQIQVTFVNHAILLWLSQRHEGNFPTSGSIIHSTDKLFYDILDGVQREGDAILLRVKHHVPSHGRLSEQFNRDTGIPQGASDLTWSYSSIIEVAHQRNLFLQLHNSEASASEE